jgi:hypothetical protein
MQITSTVQEKLNRFGVGGQMNVEHPHGDLLAAIEAQGRAHNFAINSGFKYLQGKSASATAAPSANAYHFDHFATITKAGTINLSQQTSSAPAGSQYYKRVAYAAGSSRYVFGQALEAALVSQLAGKTIYVAVKVKKNSTFDKNVELKIQTNDTADTFSGGTWTTVKTKSVSYNDISASAFTTISTTIALGSSILGLRLSIGDSAAPANGSQLDYAQVQICAADVLPEYVLFGGNDQADQRAVLRHFVAYVGVSGGMVLPSQMVLNDADKVQFVHQLPVPMRSIPTVAFVGSRGIDWDIETLAGVAEADGVFASGASANPGSALHGAFEFADTAMATASVVHRVNLKTTSGQLTFLLDCN